MPAEFDVFLSHNSQDKPVVEEIGEWLRSRGLRVWLDKWELRPGFPWQEGLEEGVRSSRAVAVFVGEGGLGAWQEPEMRAFIARSRREQVPVIPVLLPGCPDSPQLALFLEAFTWVDLREGLTEGGLARLVWGITGEKPEEPGAVAAAPSGHRALPSNLKTTRARWSWGIGLSLLGAPRPHRRKTGNGDPLVRRDWRSQGPRYRRLLGGPVLPGRRILEQGGRKTGKSDAEIKTAIETLAPTAPKKE